MIPATKICCRCKEKKIAALHFSLKSTECRDCVKKYNAVYKSKMKKLSKAVSTVPYDKIAIGYFKRWDR